MVCNTRDNVDSHLPVLLKEVMENLSVKSDGIYLDATFGRGGHSKIILSQLGPTGRLLAMDKDPQAIVCAQQNFTMDPRFKYYYGSFAELQQFAVEQNCLGKINGILLDLGVSSPQLDDPDRGFSFMRDGKLDMRMDNEKGIDAASWLASVDEKELSKVLWEYGEERYARRVARAIISARQVSPITSTAQLAKIVADAIPRWQKGKHPATRSFQAIRIEINRELKDLELGLAQSLEALAVGGILLVISFHSLEDRIVKHFIQQNEKGGEFPAGLPVKQSSYLSRLKRLGRAIKPSPEEVAKNPRARSAILRIAEKIR